HIVGGLLRRDQRALQSGLELAILLKGPLETGDLLAQPFVLPQGLIVAGRGFFDDRGDLRLVEAAHCGLEPRLTKVERRDVVPAVFTVEHFGSRKSRFPPARLWRPPARQPRSRRSFPSTARGASFREHRRPASPRAAHAACETRVWRPPVY